MVTGDHVGVKLGWVEVRDRVNTYCQTDFELLRKLPGGRQGGAWVVAQGGDQEQVLTFTQHSGIAARRAETAGLIEKLRGKGYPTPPWRHWGVLDDDLAFVVSDLVDGRPSSWEVINPERLIATVELQADIALPAAETWSTYALATLEDPEGLRAVVASLGSDGTAFLDRLDAGLPDLTDVRLPDTDAVHGDLESGNILLTPTGEIQIIDLDSCGPGTRALDYAWLYRDAYSHGATRTTTSALRRQGLRIVGDAGWAACLSLACLELVSFVAREGTKEGARYEIDRLPPI